jgi:tRNA A-37 threonylcarbamoyl transferase component Bud32
LVVSEAQHPETLDQGRYQVERLIGAGGTATVLLALDTRIGVRRAIKLLRPKYAQDGETRTRFQNEAHAQAALQHTNVLMVHDAVDDEQGVYLVMELADSGSLDSRVRTSGTLPAQDVIDIGITIGGALAVAHAQGLVHRDIKPANILVDRHGVLKLADFGIARQMTREEGELTRADVIMGTWAYMPPEQRESFHAVDERSDIYAFGVTLYALLTARPSTTLNNPESWAEAYAGVDPSLAAVLQRATRRFPEDRYQTAEDMVQELIQVRDGLGVAPVETPVLPPTLRGVPELHEGSAPTAVPITERSEPLPRWMVVGGAFGALIILGAGSAAAWSVFGPGDPVPHVSTFEGDASRDAAKGGVASPDGAPDGAADGAPEGAPDGSPPAVATAASGNDTPPEGAPTTAARRDAAATPSATPPVAAATPGGSTKSSSGGSAPATTRRIITVIPGPEAAPVAAAATTAEDAAPQVATGTLQLRTVPSGASVREKGRLLKASGGGAYTLPIGSHTLQIESLAGERTRLLVSVKAGETVEICYSFDTNSACGGAK